jgi:hypothetical protein
VILLDVSNTLNPSYFNCIALLAVDPLATILESTGNDTFTLNWSAIFIGIIRN